MEAIFWSVSEVATCPPPVSASCATVLLSSDLLLSVVLSKSEEMWIMPGKDKIKRI